MSNFIIGLEAVDKIVMNSICVTDVNNDCLEKIFERLTLLELLNVADCNKWLIDAACMVYYRRYGQKMIKLQDIGDSRKEKLIETEDDIELSGLRICLRFLRCFGHLILKLDVSYNLADQNYCDYMDQYITEYCVNSLIKITISSYQKGSLDWLKKLLPKIQELRFINCKLDKELTEFHKWFPNLRSLEFEGNTFISNPEFISHHFPHLEHLTTEFNENTLVGIQLNPQLRSLHIHWIFDAKLLQRAIIHLQHLEHFQIHCFDKDLLDFNGNRIHFKQVKVFKMICNVVSQGIDIPIPFTFGTLEEFSFESEGIFEGFFDFVQANPTIQKLNLGGLTRRAITISKIQSERKLI